MSDDLVSVFEQFLITQVQKLYPDQFVDHFATKRGETKVTKGGADTRGLRTPSKENKSKTTSKNKCPDANDEQREPTQCHVPRTLGYIF